jgi:putative flippase GtrA
MFKKESKRLIKYVLVGLLTTGLTWLLWNGLLWVTSPLALGVEEKFSATQYLASFLMIWPSFWLHGKVTFKDKEHRSTQAYRTTAKVFIVYICSPLVASLTTYLILSLFPGIISLFPIQAWGYQFALGKYLLQGFGLFVGMVGNYLGQRLWIYHK